MYQYLFHMAGIMVKLQGKVVDIIEAHSMIASTRDMYANERIEVAQKIQEDTWSCNEDGRQSRVQSL